MIEFANKNTAAEVRSMWKICFEDTEEYMDLYFSKKYRDENTLLYLVDDKAVASLQMIPYSIRFYGEIIPFYYLVGLCTLPEYRNKGYMGKLIRESFSVMKERHIPLSVLVPAEEGLFEYYERYEFETVFEKGQTPIDLSLSYSEFDTRYQLNDFCVLKSEDDFETILTEHRMDGCPPKYNLSGMARTITPLTLLDLYARKNADKSFSLRTGGTTYLIEKGKASIVESSASDFEINLNMLTRLLFGFHVPQHYSSLFEEHRPVLNLMLE